MASATFRVWRGDRDGGKLVDYTAEASAGMVVLDAIHRIQAESGPDALGFLASAKATNEENYLFQKLARMLGTNNIDHCARL